MPETNPAGYPTFETSINSLVLIRINSSPGAASTTGNWWCNGSIVPFTGTTNRSSCTFEAANYGVGNFYLTTSNACGTSSVGGGSIRVVEGGGGPMMFAMSPNPATTYVTVEQLTAEEAETRAVLTPETVIEIANQSSEDNSFTVEIWHERKGKMKQVKSKKNKEKIDLSGLEKGNYFLHIITPNAIYKEHLLIE